MSNLSVKAFNWDVITNCDRNKMISHNCRLWSKKWTAVAMVHTNVFIGVCSFFWLTSTAKFNVARAKCLQSHMWSKSKEKKNVCHQSCLFLVVGPMQDFLSRGLSLFNRSAIQVIPQTFVVTKEQTQKSCIPCHVTSTWCFWNWCKTDAQHGDLIK